MQGLGQGTGCLEKGFFVFFILDVERFLGGAYIVGCGKRWKEVQCFLRGQGEDIVGQTEGICYVFVERDWSFSFFLRGYYIVFQREVFRCCFIFFFIFYDKEGVKKEVGYRKGGFWEKFWSKGVFQEGLRSGGDTGQGDRSGILRLGVKRFRRVCYFDLIV